MDLTRRSRKRTKKGVYISDITYDRISSLFDKPTDEVCEKLGVGITSFKKICRRLGISRWPYRTTKKINEGKEELNVKSAALGAIKLRDCKRVACQCQDSNKSSCQALHQLAAAAAAELASCSATEQKQGELNFPSAKNIAQYASLPSCREPAAGTNMVGERAGYDGCAAISGGIGGVSCMVHTSPAMHRPVTPALSSCSTHIIRSNVNIGGGNHAPTEHFTPADLASALAGVPIYAHVVDDSNAFSIYSTAAAALAAFQKALHKQQEQRVVVRHEELRTLADAAFDPISRKMSVYGPACLSVATNPTQRLGSRLGCNAGLSCFFIPDVQQKQQPLLLSGTQPYV